MTSTELIAEARELDQMATPGPWFNFGDWMIHTESNAEKNGIIHEKTIGSVKAQNAEYIARSRTLIPALCDALEQAQSTLEQTWEWDMYQCAQREIDRLRKELEAAQNAQRWKGDVQNG